MVYNLKQTIPSSTKTLELYVASCIKCNNDDIKIEEYEDMYGFISNATCKNQKCKNNERTNGGIRSVIKQWNDNNDIPTLIENKGLLIDKTKVEIIHLKILLKSRNKVSKKSKAVKSK